MRILALFIALIALASAEVLLLRSPKPEKRVDGSYIIVFKKNVNEETIVNYFSLVNQQSIEHQTFHIGKFRGLSAKLTNDQLNDHLLLDNLIEYIEEDQVVHAAACNRQANPDWNLDRMSEVELDLTDEAEYVYDSLAGSGVDSYIVDTGIRTTHTEFGGRARWGYNSVDTDNRDCNGHGTHVAGTVGGTLYGVAKKVNLIAVKVLNCQGSGTYAGVIAGINWVAQQYASTQRPSNANMSLGGSYSAAVNDAVNAAVTAGVVFVVAAGNDNSNACNYSPASAASAITVGATTTGTVGEFGQTDVRSSFSNWGSCVDVFAPGQLIKSSWHTTDTATNVISGTSMASPHVCGLVSLIQSISPSLSPAAIARYVIDTATPDLIQLQCTSSGCLQSPNLLAYHGCA